MDRGSWTAGCAVWAYGCYSMSGCKAATVCEDSFPPAERFFGLIRHFELGPVDFVLPLRNVSDSRL